MCAINEDPSRPVVMRHLVVETTVQLKVHQKKGEVNDRFDAIGCILREMLASENHVTKTVGRIVRLATRRGRLMKELLEKGILVESRGYEENLRSFNGDGEAEPSVSTGHTSARATDSGGIETADVLHKKNIYILQE